MDHLAEIYQHRSRYVVMFISEHYVNKAWPQHERQHAQARALVARDEYILPVRFDDTPVPGMTGNNILDGGTFMAYSRPISHEHDEQRPAQDPD